MIYGTAVLAACYLIGLTLGESLGAWMGIKANVGGVGIAMLLLLLARGVFRRHGVDPPVLGGVVFWGGMYIPVVVATALQLDVHKALGAGLVALLAAGITVVICAWLVRWINRHEPAVAPVASEGGDLND
jgi:malonate transporter MadL subunit